VQACDGTCAVVGVAGLIQVCLDFEAMKLVLQIYSTHSFKMLPVWPEAL
jgi:hypothetical protein